MQWKNLGGTASSTRCSATSTGSIRPMTPPDERFCRMPGLQGFRCLGLLLCRPISARRNAPVCKPLAGAGAELATWSLPSSSSPRGRRSRNPSSSGGPGPLQAESREHGGDRVRVRLCASCVRVADRGDVGDRVAAARRQSHGSDHLRLRARASRRRGTNPERRSRCPARTGERPGRSGESAMWPPWRTPPRRAPRSRSPRTQSCEC